MKTDNVDIELQKNEIPKECEPCVCSKYIMECLIVYEKMENECPCRECLLQVTCGHNPCDKFKDLMLRIHRKRDDYWDWGGIGTIREPLVRGV